MGQYGTLVDSVIRGEKMVMHASYFAGRMRIHLTLHPTQQTMHTITRILIIGLLVLGWSVSSWAGGSVISSSISGPTFCEDGVDPQTPTAYTADVTINCSGVQSHTWTLTGGMFVDASNQPLVFVNGQPMMNGSFKLVEDVFGCSPGDPACVPVTNVNDGFNNVIRVRWDPNAPLQRLSLSASENSCSTSAEIVNKRALAATSMTLGATTCTTRTVTANVPDTGCRPPTRFRWFVNGSLFPTPSTETVTLTVNPSTTNQIAVEPVYGNTIGPGLSSRLPRSSSGLLPSTDRIISQRRVSTLTVFPSTHKPP